MTSTAAGAMALALDELLQALDADPELARGWLEQHTSHIPTALRDQLQAARSDARRWFLTESTLIGGDVHHPGPDDIPTWIRLPLYLTCIEWLTGRARTCLHDPHPDRPEPVFAAAWRPGVVHCAACPQLTALRRGSAADRTCDGCGRVVAGPESGDGIFPGRIQLGPLLYAYGTCRDCRPTSEGCQ